MRQEVLLREAGVADIPMFRDIALRTWPVAYRDILSTEQLAYMLELMYSEASLRAQFARGDRFLLAGTGDGEVGFAGFTHHHAGVCTTRLHKLYVLPGTQGTGIGMALLNAVVAAASEAADEAVELNVNRFNPARHFYARRGFRIVRNEVIDIGHGHVMDDHVMRLDLASA